VAEVADAMVIVTRIAAADMDAAMIMATEAPVTAMMTAAMEEGVVMTTAHATLIVMPHLDERIGTNAVETTAVVAAAAAATTADKTIGLVDTVSLPQRRSKAHAVG